MILGYVVLVTSDNFAHLILSLLLTAIGRFTVLHILQSQKTKNEFSKLERLNDKCLIMPFVDKSILSSTNV